MFKALKSFSGKVSMSKGQVMDIHDEAVVRDLLKAGYIEEVKAKAESVKPEKVEPVVETPAEETPVEEKPKKKKSSSKKKKASN